MITNLTRDDISTNIDQYYNGAWELTEEHPPLKAAMVAAFFPRFGLSVEGMWVDEYINDDYAIARETACLLNDFLSQCFPIRPSRAILEPDSSYGLTLEWCPSKPLYIYSRVDYLNLYVGFWEYLKGIPNDNEISNEFKICFSPLYLSELMNHVPDTSDYKEMKFIYPELFTDYFKSPDKTIIQTHGAIFQIDNYTNCPMNNFYNSNLKNLIKQRGDES